MAEQTTGNYSKDMKEIDEEPMMTKVQSQNRQKRPFLAFPEEAGLSCV